MPEAFVLLSFLNIGKVRNRLDPETVFTCKLRTRLAILVPHKESASIYDHYSGNALFATNHAPCDGLHWAEKTRSVSLRDIEKPCRDKFSRKLGWLRGFETELLEWRAMLDLLDAAKKEVKGMGFRGGNLERFRRKARRIRVKGGRGKSRKRQTPDWMGFVGSWRTTWRSRPPDWGVAHTWDVRISSRRFSVATNASLPKRP